jgi:predicted negative regulator of RcsB-dependent stress response
MSNPINETETSSSERREPRAESFLDWFHVNSRWVAVGGAAVLAAGLIAWYVPKAREMKNEAADKQLLAAQQSLDPRNPNQALAESDLRKVADRYAGTPAGTEAGLVLARLQLEKGDNQAAAAYLQQLRGKVGKGPQAATVIGLLGDAYAQLTKYAEAAAQYEQAAAATTMPNEKAYLLSKAGHAYMAAGKQPEARKIWEALAAQEDNQAVAAEARVRLGELVATAARG